MHDLNRSHLHVLSTDLNHHSPMQGVHISLLPADVLRLILTWVVSEDLDLLSLEHFSAVSVPLIQVYAQFRKWELYCMQVSHGQTHFCLHFLNAGVISIFIWRQE